MIQPHLTVSDFIWMVRNCRFYDDLRQTSDMNYG